MSYHIRSIYFFNTPFISQTNRIKGAIWHIYSIEICVFMDRFHPFHFSIYLSLCVCRFDTLYPCFIFQLTFMVRWVHQQFSLSIRIRQNAEEIVWTKENDRLPLFRILTLFCHHQFHQLRFGFMSLRFRFYEVCSCFYYWFVHLVRPNFDWIAMHCCHTLNSVWNVIIEL